MEINWRFLKFTWNSLLSFLIDHSCLNSRHILKINEQILSYNFSSLESNSLSSIQWKMSHRQIRKFKCCFYFFFLAWQLINQSSWLISMSRWWYVFSWGVEENVRGENKRGCLLILSLCHSLFFEEKNSFEEIWNNFNLFVT